MSACVRDACRYATSAGQAVGQQRDRDAVQCAKQRRACACIPHEKNCARLVQIVNRMGKSICDRCMYVRHAHAWLRRWSCACEQVAPSYVTDNIHYEGILAPMPYLQDSSRTMVTVLIYRTVSATRGTRFGVACGSSIHQQLHQQPQLTNDVRRQFTAPSARTK